MWLKNTSRIFLGMACMALGLGLVLVPFFWPVFSPSIWQPFYWSGAVLMLLGGFGIDVTVMGVVWRWLLQARSKRKLSRA
jgi:hypothetical protein